MALVALTLTLSGADDAHALTKRQATAEARLVLKQTYGGSWTHGRKRRVRCVAEERRVYRCRASWTHRKQTYRRALVLVERSGRIDTSIFGL